MDSNFRFRASGDTPHRPRRPLSFVQFLSCLRSRDLWSEAREG